MTVTERAAGELTATPPFDFTRSLAFLGEFTPAFGDDAIAERSVTRAASIAAGERSPVPLAFRVVNRGTVEAPRLGYTLFAAEPLGPATTTAAEAQIAWWLSLDDDLRPFYAIGRDDPAFAPVIDALYGYHQVKFPTPFECAVWAVLSQRTPMSLAGAGRRRLIERFGGSVRVDGAVLPVFPEPEALASESPEELARVVRHARKGRYLSAVAHAFAAVEPAFLRTAPTDEVARWLRSIDGIGAWSAGFILLRALGRTERLPVSEARLDRAIAQWYNGGVPLNRGAIEGIAARYGPWQGYWAHYLRVAG